MTSRGIQVLAESIRESGKVREFQIRRYKLGRRGVEFCDYSMLGIYSDF